METPKILVADDQAGQRVVLDMLLSLDGYDIVTKEDGRETLDYLQEHTPDLVILDIDMPFVDGVEICGRIKKIKRLKDVPVIILTGQTDERVLMSAKMAKADKVIRKPLEGKDFRVTVRELLKAKA